MRAYFNTALFRSDQLALLQDKIYKFTVLPVLLYTPITRIHK